MGDSVNFLSKQHYKEIAMVAVQNYSLSDGDTHPLCYV